MPRDVDKIKNTEALNYSTLDDLPGVNDVETLYSTLFAAHEDSCGMVITGEVESGLDDDEELGYWGRAIAEGAGGGEVLQARFAPIGMCNGETQRPGTVSLVAVRCTHPICREASSVRVCILFKPGQDDIDCDMLERSVRALGAACLPVWAVGIYSRQNLEFGRRGTPVGRTPRHDGECFELLTPGSYSLVHDDGSRNRGCIAAPSLAQVVIAGEIAGVHMADPTTSLVEQVTRSQWRQSKDAAIRRLESALEQTGGTKAMASDAMGAAGAICELFTADKCLEMMASEFLEGALPAPLVRPYGMPLLIAMACRIAMHPERYGLTHGSQADRAAAAHAKMLFESTHSPLDIPSQDSRYAIDMAIRTAIENARNHPLRNHGSSKARLAQNDFAPELIKGRMYWQRIGQHVLTRLFWMGGESAYEPENDMLTKAAWRTEDPLADARKTALRNSGCICAAVDVSMIRIAELRDAKRAWMDMMSNVENWLITGEWKGKQLSPKNSPKKVDAMCASTEENALDRSVDEELLRIWFDRVNEGEKLPPPKSFKSMSREEKRRLFYQTYNLAAHERAVETMAEAMIGGPRHEQRFDMRTYVVSHTQTQTCGSCAAEVHVLQGIMAHTTYATCAHCRAHKCFECTRRLRDAIDTGDVRLIERQTCRHCGRGPPRLPVGASSQTVGLSDAEMHDYIVRACKHFNMESAVLRDE